MATIIPSDLTELALSGVHLPEIETLRYLRDELSDAYTVFHGVHWTREYKGKTLYGEIDFIIINQIGKVLLIEQKNGKLTENEKDGLIKWYGDTPKSVVNQVRRSMENIQEKFTRIHGVNNRLQLEYLIYCPDYRVKTLNASAIDKNRVVDGFDKDYLAKKIEKILPLKDDSISRNREIV